MIKRRKFLKIKLIDKCEGICEELMGRTLYNEVLLKSELNEQLCHVNLLKRFIFGEIQNEEC